MQRSLVHPVVPIPSLRVSHLPCQDLDFHMREAANVVFSEVPCSYTQILSFILSLVHPPVAALEAFRLSHLTLFW